MTLHDDAALAVRLVREAGALAHRMRAGGLAAERKTSISDVVTAADHAAERLVVDTLATERPTDGVLGEEGADRAGTTGRTWVIDPVDGTYNFVSGLDWWCSALALTDGDDLVLGAVYHPATDRAFVGGPDLPTTVNGAPLPRLVDRPLAEGCLTTYLHPPSYDGEVGAAFARMVRGAATLRMLGSASMDATAIASGELHVRCQHSLPAWDDLPGAALILGAGGATVRVEAAGVSWTAAGVPTAVADVAAALAE
ncbi:inositol monophosphatase family protein [Nocardioides sp. URHA0020]|uniref:inositol monophosphatase family protein n=1 Tax=Nocardioides sp. URHA0020 TaxID=1380392 RepID=UPI00055C003A|nr:inositol monophosphatase [Nocardioides sp. URHA0020]